MWLFVLGPVLAVGAATLLHLAGFWIFWPLVALGGAGGLALSVAVGVAGGLVGGVAGGLALGVAVGVAFGLAGCLALGVAGGLAGCLAAARIPTFLLETVFTWCLARFSRHRPAAALRAAAWLPFLRAAGESLQQIRFLLLTAFPFERHGRHWIDRLVSIRVRRIGYLDEASAYKLVREPREGFLDIYPPGGIDLILQRTHRHPYLIQRVCDELCKRLHERRSLRATDDDLEAAFDALLGGHAGEDGDTGLQELWDQRTDEERACLLRMVDGEVPAPRDPAARALLREEFLEERDGKLVIAVPLFQEWIAKNG